MTISQMRQSIGLAFHVASVIALLLFIAFQPFSITNADAWKVTAEGLDVLDKANWKLSVGQDDILQTNEIVEIRRKVLPNQRQENIVEIVLKSSKPFPGLNSVPKLQVGNKLYEVGEIGPFDAHIITFHVSARDFEAMKDGSDVIVAYSIDKPFSAEIIDAWRAHTQLVSSSHLTWYFGELDKGVLKK